MPDQPDKTLRIARVLVQLSLNREFDYRIPDALMGRVFSGSPVVVPFGRTQMRGFVVGLKAESEHANLKEILALEGEKPLIGDDILALARWMGEYYLAPAETALRAVLPGAVRRKTAGFVERLRLVATEAGRDPAAIEAVRRRAPKQAALLDTLASGDSAFAAVALRRAHSDMAAARALEKKGLVRIESAIAERDPMEGDELLPTEPHALMPQQAEALEQIRQAMEARPARVVLLHGVTGSGKTEVYLQALQRVLVHGGGGIVLVPEIALTPQTVERFRGRFGDCVAVLHSHLSDGERHDEWHRIHAGRARVVVGARSALFAPVRGLGLIVVDEEHEHTYKQEEAPRYNARDMAVMRGRRENCAVLLGSATPSLESWRNARLGKYVLASMPHRVDHRQMPAIRIVDLRTEVSREGHSRIFSQALVEAIRERLARAEQTILFLNRRGFATSLVCPKCGHVAQCGACSLSMTYHKRDHLLRCHLCGAERAVPARCPNPDCRDPDFRYAGVGTERIEEILGRLFPRARVARMDSDTMTRRESYRSVLGAFRTGRLDILVGTQMIAKGLDFPNVTLVGVIHADLSLHQPDFRAGERTFQMLVQVAGRAGRGEVPGEVIVQTHTPQHPAIQAARRMDWAGFCDEELTFREQLGYPPFTHLVCVTLKGEKEESVRDAASALEAAWRPRLGPEVILSPPLPSPIPRIQGLFRYQMTARAPATKAVTGPLRAALDAWKPGAGVQWTVDVDALSLM
jgi:primosomal protein N' (replication factor Y)